MRDAGSQKAVLGQHAGRQDEHLLEVCCPRLDLEHLPSRLVSAVVHPSIMPPAGRSRSLALSRSQATRGGTADLKCRERSQA